MRDNDAMKKNKLIYNLLPILVTAVILTTVTLAAAGGADDPVATLSYIENTLLPEINKKITSVITDKINPILPAKQQAANSALTYTAQDADRAFKEMVAKAALKQGYGIEPTPKGWTRYTLYRGAIITGQPGTSVIVFSGGAMVEGSPVINLTNGTELTNARALTNGSRYMLAANANTSVVITSAAAEVWVAYGQRVTPPHPRRNNKMADARYPLGMFRGTNDGYLLENRLTRAQGVALFLRLIGEEEAALKGGLSNPFTDVTGDESWAADLVAYAYSKGYVNGISASLFAPGEFMSIQHFNTLLLRALGYKEGRGPEYDFYYLDALDKCVGIGMLTSAQASRANGTFFRRDNAVELSWRALDARYKNSTATMADSLLNSGFITYQQLSRARELAGESS